MTETQKIQLELSKTRERLGVLAGMSGEEFGADQREEVSKLTESATNLEARYRAAVVVEQEEMQKRQAADPEHRKVTRELRCAPYVRSVLGEPLTGAEREYSEEYNLTHDQLPLAALARRENGNVQKRADTVTPVPSDLPGNQPDFLGDIFAGSDADFLGVSMKTVPSGEHLTYVLTTSATPQMLAKGAQREAAAAGFEAHKMSPTSARTRIMFHLEDAALIPQLEEALRMNMAAAIRNLIDDEIIKGSGTAPALDGFLSNSNVPTTQGAVQTTAVMKAADVINAWSDGIDGVLATRANEVRVLMPSAAWSAGATLTLDKSAVAWNYGSDLGVMYKITSRIPYDASSTGASANASAGAKLCWNIRRKGNMPMEACLAAWDSVRLVRDEYSRADYGQILLTLNVMRDFAIFRNDSFEKFKQKPTA